MSINYDSLSLETPFLNESHHQWRAQVRRFYSTAI